LVDTQIVGEDSEKIPFHLPLNNMSYHSPPS
jgi:hypothetical protein